VARITVEDCLDHVENRFELVIKASERARKLMSGAQDTTLDWADHKATVIALKEIAAGMLSADTVDQSEAS
jgi:DNA-directed RNA polymerase subunit omega